jgi:predicted enzyme related to lactoylglutathione lyase
MTTDTQAAKAFYGKVVGWGAQDAPMPGMQGRFKWSSQRLMRSYDDQMEAAIGSFW